MTSRRKGTPPASATLIRQRLKERGMQVKDLAILLGYVDEKGDATGYTYSLLSGTQPLSRRQLGLIADALELDADALYLADGMIPPDLEQRLTTDRAFLEAVRRLNDQQ